MHALFKNSVQQQSKISSPNGIDTLISLTIDDIEQWMLIRSPNRTLPVLLILHGGPGAPLFPVARRYGKITGLERMFRVVYWEQPGTGKSYHTTLSDESISLPILIQHTHEVSLYLKNTFDVEKIYLLGRSFGSLLAVLTANHYPQDYEGLVSVSQVVCPLQADSISYYEAVRWAQQKRDQKLLDRIQTIGLPPYDVETLLTQRKILTKIHDERVKVEKPNYFQDLISTPEYSIIDIITMGFDPVYSVRAVWDDEFYRIDLRKDIVSLHVPVLFILGEKDNISPTALAVEFISGLTAPSGKHYSIFQNAGHEPDLSEPEAFQDLVYHYILSRKP